MPIIKINPSNIPIKIFSKGQEKPFDKWSNRDFLFYFSLQYHNLTESPYKIPGEAWIGMLSRIKGFRQKLNLDNEQYKKFIDDVFDKFFIKDNYVPSFGSIVSEKVFYTIKKINSLNIESCTNNEFTKLRDQLYSNNDLFKKLL